MYNALIGAVFVCCMYMMLELFDMTVGLEIHLKIKSETKLFCQCHNQQDFDSIKPNTTICPVCTGQPGALPVLSKGVLRQSLRLGRALACEIKEFSSFDRKSYFYPDLPLGYQITQLYNPTCVNGQLKFFMDNFSDEKLVKIAVAQMEVDTGKSIHNQGKALVDYNRSGTPLVEVVTGPDFSSSDEVVEFLKELQRLARYNGVSDADMEKGQMRVDVNISIKEKGADMLGTRVELKNINSFSAIKRAIENEYARQVSMVQNGEAFSQQTRRWDDQNKESYLMRSKEDALDYRYFPEPDLPPLHIDAKLREKLYAENIIIPHDIIKQMKEEFGFNKEYINALIGDETTLTYFQDMCRDGYDPKLVAKWLSGPIAAYCKEHYVSIDRLPFDETEFRIFLDHANAGKLIESQLKIVMAEMLSTDKKIQDIIREKAFGEETLSDEDLKVLIQKILTDNPGVVEQYKAGKETTMGFFLGQVMKQTKGQVSPNDAQAKLKQALSQV